MYSSCSMMSENRFLSQGAMMNSLFRFSFSNTLVWCLSKFSVGIGCNPQGVLLLLYIILWREVCRQSICRV